MKKFKITFVDYAHAKSEEDAYKILVDYLKDCGKFEDVTAFDFKEVGEDEEKTSLTSH